MTVVAYKLARLQPTYLNPYFDAEYNTLIGASRTETVTYQVPVWRCDGDDGGLDGGDGFEPEIIGRSVNSIELMPMPNQSSLTPPGFEDGDGNPVDPGDTPIDGPEPTPPGPTPPTPPSNCEWVWETYSYRSVIVQPSDGLVPASTQKMDNVNGADVITVQGVNHLEVGNHPEMTDALNSIFNRPTNSVFYRKTRD